MTKLKKWIDIHIESIYIIFLNVYILALILDTNFVYALYINSIIIKILKLPIIVVSVYKILFIDYKSYNWKNVIVLTSIMLLLCISMIVSHSSNLVQLFIIIVGSYKLDFDKIIKTTLIFEGSIFLFIIVISLIGILPNWTFTRGKEIVRNSFGFQYSSYLSIFIFSFSIYYLYYRKQNIKWYEYLILSGLNFVSFIVTNTRLPLLLSVLSIVLFVFLNRKRYMLNKKSKKLILNSLFFLFVSCICVSIILPIIYDNDVQWLNKLNEILSDRLALGKKGLNNYGIKLFGNKIEIIGLAMIHEGVANITDFFVIDSTYFSILLENGILVMLVLTYYLLKINIHYQ